MGRGHGMNAEVTVNLTTSASNFTPTTDDGAALGTTALQWSDLFLASGGVINWNNGDVTLTHAANELTVGGGDLLVANGFGVVVGHTAQVTTDAVMELQVLGTAGADSGMIIGRWSADALQPQIEFVKSRNAAIGSTTIVQDNDKLGGIHWHADDGTDFVNRCASFYAEVDDASPAANDIGTAFVWETQAGGGGALTERMRLSPAELLLLNSVRLSLGGGFGYSKIWIYDDATYASGFGSYSGDTFRIFGDSFNEKITFGYQSRSGAGWVETFRVLSSNVIIGATAAGTTAAKTLALTNSATSPSASADLAHLYAADCAGAGTAALALYQEDGVRTAAAVASTNSIPFVFNGTTYYLLCTTVRS